MEFKSFKCKMVTLPVDDIYAELKGVHKLRARHQLLCRTLSAWRLDIQQNSSQLDILDETAQNLTGRHKLLTDMLALRPNDPAIICRLQREIKAMEIQVEIWIREIADISQLRQQLEMDYSFDFLHQSLGLRPSLTNMELAALDVDRLEAEHGVAWKQFLDAANSNDSNENRRCKLLCSRIQ